jgi:hypothetical protein
MDKETSLEQLKHFLIEMFQFNANDLDFGICGGEVLNHAGVCTMNAAEKKE